MLQLSFPTERVGKRSQVYYYWVWAIIIFRDSTKCLCTRQDRRCLTIAPRLCASHGNRKRGACLFRYWYNPARTLGKPRYTTRATRSTISLFWYSEKESISTGLPTFYYAKFYKDYYIRLGIPLTYFEKSEPISSSKYFILISLITFLVLVLLLYLIYRKYEYSIVQLNKITEALSHNTPLSNISIPSGELRGIAQQIISVFNQKEEAIRGIVDARERLTLHFPALQYWDCSF